MGNSIGGTDVTIFGPFDNCLSTPVAFFNPA